MNMENLESISKASKRSAIISLVGMVVFISSLIYSTYSLQKVSKKVENTKLKVDSLDKLIISHQNTINILTKQELVSRENLKATTNLIEQSRIQTKFIHNIKIGYAKADSIVQSANNSLISIAIYGYRITNSVFDIVPKYLGSKGYTIIDSRFLKIRPSWLSYNSTVLYYDNSAQSLAKTIAQDLSNKTGHKFSYSKGNGFGVIKGQEKFTLKIHFVK